MANNIYTAVANILDKVFLGRPFGFKIKVVDDTQCICVVSYKSYHWFSYGEGKPHQVDIANLSDEKLEEIYSYLETNRFTLDEFKEPEMDMDKEWEIEPLEIKTEEGETVGAVGVVFDEVLGANRVVFLSSDATASTITIFGKGDPEEKKLAMQDLQRMSEILLEINNKLQTYEETKNSIHINETLENTGEGKQGGDRPRE